MGLASSQMRMITITKRLNDVEQELMHNSNKRLAISRKTSALSAEHAAALNSTKVVYGTASSNTDVSYSMFNNASLGYALTSSSGAVMLTSSDVASWGLKGGKMNLDQEPFVEKAAGVTPEVYDAYIKGTQKTPTPTKTGNPIYTFTYKDNDVFNKMNAADSSYSLSADTANPRCISNVGWGATDITSNIKKSATAIATASSTALLAVLEKNYGDNWSYVEADMQAAAALAKQATIEYYSLEDADFNGQNDGDRSNNNGADYDAGIIHTYCRDYHEEPDKNCKGTTEIVSDAYGNCYVDATEVTKFFLNQFDSYASKIATNAITQDQVAEINANKNLQYDEKYLMDKTQTETTSISVRVERHTGPKGDDHNDLGGILINKSRGTGSTDQGDGTCTVAGATTEETKKVSESDKIKYYINLFNQIKESGYKVNDNITDSDYLSDQLSLGNIVILNVASDSNVSLDGAASDFITVDDDNAADQADADFEAEKDKLDYQSSILDTTQNSLDTERSALTTEQESVKKVQESNIKVLSLFQNA